jgi:hypothetical protein
LWDGAIEQERIKQIDVIDHEKTGALRIETRRTYNFYPRTGKKYDPAAEATLKPVVFVRIQENSQKNEKRRDHEKMYAAQKPEKRTAQRQQSSLHI